MRVRCQQAFDDGLYQLRLIRGSSEIAATTMQIRQGRFSMSMVSAMEERFEIQGFVSEDGTLSLLSLAPDFLFAEAYINPDTKHIAGMYFVSLGDDIFVGDLRGSISD